MKIWDLCRHRHDDAPRSKRRGDGNGLTIEFELEKNGAVAAQEVDAKVRTIFSQLPEGTDALAPRGKSPRSPVAGSRKTSNPCPVSAP